MSQVSRPMQIALAATLLLLAVWFVALRPKPSTVHEAAAPAQPTPAPASDAAPGTAGLKRAIDKAHGAVTTADADAQRAQQSSADSPAPGTAASTQTDSSTAKAHSGTATTSHDARAGGGSEHASGGHAASAHAASAQVGAVKAALRHHNAVALAFVDPNTADARAVAREIRHVSHFGGRAVVLAVPLAQLSDFGFITSSVEVTIAPTVVIVDPRRQATTIVGFADRGEIQQRLADALATKRH